MSSTGASSPIGRKWTPLVKYASEGWLGVDPGGGWVYGDPANPGTDLPSGGEAAVLLPLLAKPYPELASQLRDSLTDLGEVFRDLDVPQFLSQLATYALRERVREEQKQQAKAWFDAGCPLTDEAQQLLRDRGRTT